MCRVCKDEIYSHILIFIFFEKLLLYLAELSRAATGELNLYQSFHW